MTDDAITELEQHCEQLLRAIEDHQQWLGVQRQTVNGRKVASREYVAFRQQHISALRQCERDYRKAKLKLSKARKEAHSDPN